MKIKKGPNSSRVFLPYGPHDVFFKIYLGFLIFLTYLGMTFGTISHIPNFKAFKTLGLKYIPFIFLGAFLPVTLGHGL